MSRALRNVIVGAAVCSVVAFAGSMLQAGDAKAKQAAGGSPADDPAQTVGGVVVTTGFVTNADVAVGPFYLTDADGVASTVENYSGVNRLYIVPSGSPCDATGATLLWSVGAGASFHGARYFIAANQKLCANNATGSGAPSVMVWSGFRPY